MTSAAGQPAGTAPDCSRAQVDPRGPRFGGAVTTLVLAAALILIGTTASTVLIVVQTLVFAVGAIVGPHAQPYGIFFRKVIRPRLAPPAEMEDAAPPRFAQAVGLVFLLGALAALLLGSTAVATVFVAFALAAAFLNAAFNFCLGCQMYLIGRRLAHR